VVSPAVKIFIVTLIVFALFMPLAGAAAGTQNEPNPHQINENSKIFLHAQGSTASDKSRVDISGNGEIGFTHTPSGIGVSSRTKINGDQFISSEKGKEKDKGVSFTHKKQGGSVSDAEFIYEYYGNTLKETIILQENMDLSFELTVPVGSMVIPFGDSWKIVSTNGYTMEGIEIEKPFGYDLRTIRAYVV
jgi:hypothetical protein